MNIKLKKKIVIPSFFSEWSIINLNNKRLISLSVTASLIWPIESNLFPSNILQHGHNFGNFIYIVPTFDVASTKESTDSSIEIEFIA